MKRTEPNFLVEGMRLVAVCPLCQSEQATSRHILEATENECLVHATCLSCKGAIIALMHRQDAGVSFVGIMTDLAEGEVYRLMDGRVIGTDAVLSVHEALNKSDFLQAFR